MKVCTERDRRLGEVAGPEYGGNNAGSSAGGLEGDCASRQPATRVCHGQLHVEGAATTGENHGSDPERMRNRSELGEDARIGLNVMLWWEDRRGASVGMTGKPEEELGEVSPSLCKLASNSRAA